MASLKKLENLIEANEKLAWYENNLILLKIRNEKIYKKEYENFEVYLKSRWDVGESRGYQLMKSAELMLTMTTENLHKTSGIVEVSLPRNEGQCRPLLQKLDHNGERLHVWDEVVKTREKNVLYKRLLRGGIDSQKCYCANCADIAMLQKYGKNSDCKRAEELEKELLHISIRWNLSEKEIRHTVKQISKLK